MQKQGLFFSSFFLLLSLLLFSSPAMASEPIVSVRIGGGISTNPTVIYISSGYYNVRSTDGKIATLRVGTGTPYGNTLKLTYNKVLDAVYLENKGYFSGSFLIEPILAGSTDNYVSFKNKRYRDSFEIKVSTSKLGLNVINKVSMEDYLKGVVPREMSNSWPLEALKAQAIAARTYAFANMNKHKSDGFGLCDTDHCQVYGGASAEGSNSTAAVNATAGVAAKYNGAYISALYASNHGGYSENSENVWGGRYSYLRAVSSPWDKVVMTIPQSSWTYQWTKVMTKAQVEAALKLSNVQRIYITKRTVSGRVAEAKIYYGSNQVKTVTGNYLRSSSVLNLKSTLFDINADTLTAASPLSVVTGNSTGQVTGSQSLYAVSGSGSITKLNTSVPLTLRGLSASIPYGKAFTALTFNGRGWGHGVGLSQWGAYGMAKGFDGTDFNGTKYTFDQILKHYYSGISLTKVY